ncbi:MAG TPA: hypothetical protein VL979_15335 [Solirubrobacteraceae bacterium]|nr:hypothetical protein [Solirubrobacteraceae bacterium]
MRGNKIKIMGMGALAALVLGVFVASASASPAVAEFATCVKQAGGKYSNKTCTAEVLSGGSYERGEAKEAKIKGKAKAITLHITGEGAKAETITCRKSAVSGEYYEDSIVFKLKMEDCANSEKVVCGVGKKGTIETGEWGVFVPFLNEAETEVAANTQPYDDPSFNCGSETFTLEGEEYLIGKIKATGKAVSIQYGVNGGGEQEEQYYYEEEHRFGPSHLAHNATLAGEITFKMKGVYLYP